MGELVSYSAFLERKMKKEEVLSEDEKSYKDLMDDPGAIERLLRDVFTTKTS